MARKKCPKCKRDTYSEKNHACFACDFKVTPVTGDDMVNTKHVTPVTSNSVALRVLDSGAAQVDLAEPLPGETCVLCREKKPSAAALKQREWRARKR